MYLHGEISLTSLAESEVLSSDLPPPCSSFPFPLHQRQTASASKEIVNDKYVNILALAVNKLPAGLNSEVFSPIRSFGNGTRTQVNVFT